MLQELDLPCSGGGEGADLIVLAVHNEDWNVDHFKIVVKLGFGENFDALIVGRSATHHPLTPPVLSNPLGDDRAPGRLKP
jgi:hypothetical protein